jgi:hypothetical protein
MIDDLRAIRVCVQNTHFTAMPGYAAVGVFDKTGRIKNFRDKGFGAHCSSAVQLICNGIYPKPETAQG